MKEKGDMREWIYAAAVYTGASFGAAWLFYDSLYAGFAFAPFFFIFLKTVKAAGRRKRAEELTDGFMKALSSVSSSSAAGLSPENAFVMAASDMEKLYGKDSAIVRELTLINSRTVTGRRLADALNDFAKRSQIPEICDFAAVFSVAKENGSDLSAVINSCTEIMENRRQAENDARVLIRAKQYEQRLMCALPPAILAYMRFSSGSFMDVLYHNAFGAIVMTGCLAVYVLAIVLSEKIGDVKV